MNFLAVGCWYIEIQLISIGLESGSLAKSTYEFYSLIHRFIPLDLLCDRWMIWDDDREGVIGLEINRTSVNSMRSYFFGGKESKVRLEGALLCATGVCMRGVKTQAQRTFQISCSWSVGRIAGKSESPPSVPLSLPYFPLASQSLTQRLTKWNIMPR